MKIYILLLNPESVNALILSFAHVFRSVKVLARLMAFIRCLVAAGLLLDRIATNT